MLMSFGLFVFEIDSAPYNDLARRSSYRHARSPRVGARDASQFVGPGDDTVTLSGTIAPEAGGRHAAIRSLQSIAEDGQALPLVDGAGLVHGDFVIEDIDVRQHAFMSNGVAQISDFTISLRRVDDVL